MIPQVGRHRVSCVLPVRDEEGAIGSVVPAALEALASLAVESELIVVDDGSTDGTGARLDDLAAHDPRLRVIHFREPRGYGAALRAGFDASRLPVLAFTDGDGQFDLQDLDRVLPLLGDADLVVGYRVDRADPASRRLLSRGYNALVRLLIGVRVRDVNCAFKVFHRRVLDLLPLESDGFAVNAELVARAAAAGLRVREVGVRHFARIAGRSKVGAVNVPGTLRQLWTLRRLLTVDRGAPGSVTRPATARDRRA